MEPIALRTLLEELAERLGVDVRYEPLGAGDQWSSVGGLCTLRSRQIILVDSRAPITEQVGVLLDSLAQLDIETIYVPPAVREALSRRRD